MRAPPTFRILAALIVGALLGGGSVEAGDFYAGQDAFKRGDYELAHRHWLELAEEGDAESQFRLARLYVEGRGVETDDATAVSWYRRAAAQGHPRAQASLGFMLQTGRGVEADLDEAITWYRKAAEQDRASAQYNLGKLYLDGEGVAADEETALRWLRRAGEQGHAPALTTLARMHEEGRGVATDPGRAFKLQKRAAGRRHPEAQFQLGRMFESGIGTEADVKKALRSYQAAAQQGHVEATAALDRLFAPAEARANDPVEPPVPAVEPLPAAKTPVAVTANEPVPTVTAQAVTPAAEATLAGTPQERFERGRDLLLGDGVPRDLVRAESWLRSAAESGHGEAAYRLALFLFRGEGGGGKSYARAYVWFTRAAEQDVGDAAAWRDRIYKKMNGREREEARRLLEP